MPPTKVRIAPQFEAENLERSADWYASVGFETDRLDARTAWLSFDGQPLLLARSADPEPSRAVVTLDAGSSLNDLYETLEHRAVVFLECLGPLHSGFRGFTVCDLDGNLITFAQRERAELRLIQSA